MLAEVALPFVEQKVCGRGLFAEFVSMQDIPAKSLEGVEIHYLCLGCKGSGAFLCAQLLIASLVMPHRVMDQLRSLHERLQEFELPCDLYVILCVYTYIYIHARVHR